MLINGFWQCKSRNLSHKSLCCDTQLSMNRPLIYLQKRNSYGYIFIVLTCSVLCEWKKRVISVQNCSLAKSFIFAFDCEKRYFQIVLKTPVELEYLLKFLILCSADNEDTQKMFDCPHLSNVPLSLCNCGPGSSFIRKCMKHVSFAKHLWFAYTHSPKNQRSQKGETIILHIFQALVIYQMVCLHGIKFLQFKEK